jgi:hypothetical protein
MKLICEKREAEYFLQRDWTGQISLIRLDKLRFARIRRARAGKLRSPDEGNGSARRARGGTSDRISAKARQVNCVHWHRNSRNLVRLVVGVREKVVATAAVAGAEIHT